MVVFKDLNYTLPQSDIQTNFPEDLVFNNKVNFFVGANGYGKSVFLRAIERKFRDMPFGEVAKLDVSMTKDHLARYIKDDYTDGKVVNPKLKAVFIPIDMFSSDGYHVLLETAMLTTAFSIKDVATQSESYTRQVILNQLYDQLTVLKEFDCKLPIYITLDGFDSGVSADVATFYAKNLDRLLGLFPELNVFVFATTNSYTFCNKKNWSRPIAIYDAQTLDKVSFSGQEDFDAFIVKTSTIEKNNKLKF
jgi:hypothetical protein